MCNVGKSGANGADLEKRERQVTNESGAKVRTKISHFFCLHTLKHLCTSASRSVRARSASYVCANCASAQRELCERELCERVARAMRSGRRAVRSERAPEVCER